MIGVSFADVPTRPRLGRMECNRPRKKRKCVRRQRAIHFIYGGPRLDLRWPDRTSSSLACSKQPGSAHFLCSTRPIPPCHSEPRATESAAHQRRGEGGGGWRGREERGGGGGGIARKLCWYGLWFSQGARARRKAEACPQAYFRPAKPTVGSRSCTAAERGAGGGPRADAGIVVHSDAQNVSPTMLSSERAKTRFHSACSPAGWTALIGFERSTRISTHWSVEVRPVCALERSVGTSSPRPPMTPRDEGGNRGRSAVS